MAFLLSYQLKGITMTGLPMLFNAVQVAKIMGVSKSQVYNLMNSGRLGSVSIGRSRRVTNSQMNEFITSLTSDLWSVILAGSYILTRGFFTASKAETHDLVPDNKNCSLNPVVLRAAWWTKWPDNFHQVIGTPDVMHRNYASSKDSSQTVRGPIRERSKDVPELFPVPRPCSGSKAST